MNITFGQAEKSDIPQLIRLRLAYMEDDFGSVSEREKSCMEKQLPDYFERKPGQRLGFNLDEKFNRVCQRKRP